jgi:hypothetical protein
MGAGDAKDDKKDVVMESAVYRKKANVLDDRAAWTCYSVRIFTKFREIGVMGVRRKCMCGAAVLLCCCAAASCFLLLLLQARHSLPAATAALAVVID